MKPTGTIHFAKYETSPRLQRVLAYMLHGQPRTGREIILGADVNAVSSAADELRANGFDFRCIKQNTPPTYQLFDVDQAKALSARLLNPEQEAVNG
ncbi:MAG: hypothetical protein A2Y38_10100 [Spirochaetes bacterium GWB1_59_5]|nr:MAG: hypothetical protein A2Y38_10100 [Spirochaetes bacterium GWB1_59_5]